MNLEFEPVGALVTATLAAGEIEREGGAAVRKHGHANCANCQTPLTGSFCHACGQRDHVHRSLLHLGEEFLHGLLHFDAKAWRTLPLLIAKPGKLTREYIEGKRTRFVSPLALFLFMVFFMFFAVSGLSRTSVEDLSGSITAATTGSLPAANEKKEGTLRPAVAPGNDAMDDANVNTGWPKLDAAIMYAIKNPQFTLYKLKNAASKFSFLLVPISLPFLWLMFFWKRGVTMYDHAVFTLYSLSFMALLVVVLALLKTAGLKSLVTWLVFLAPPLHMFAQLRGTYSLGFGSTLWRTVVLLCVSFTVFISYLLLILMLSMG
ncbi:MAG: DUF3667 domain-containing protein [Pseudomonadota bacterium]